MDKCKKHGYITDIRSDQCPAEYYTTHTHTLLGIRAERQVCVYHGDHLTLCLSFVTLMADIHIMSLSACATVWLPALSACLPVCLF